MATVYVIEGEVLLNEGQPKAGPVPAIRSNDKTLTGENRLGFYVSAVWLISPFLLLILTTQIAFTQTLS
jgi:hypothetical protein